MLALGQINIISNYYLMCIMDIKWKRKYFSFFNRRTITFEINFNVFLQIKAFYIPNYPKNYLIF